MANYIREAWWFSERKLFLNFVCGLKWVHDLCQTLMLALKKMKKIILWFVDFFAMVNILHFWHKKIIWLKILKCIHMSLQLLCTFTASFIDYSLTMKTAIILLFVFPYTVATWL